MTEPSQYHNKSEILRAVTENLSDFFASQIKRAYKYSPRYSDLIEVLRDVSLSGGKQNRPYLTVLMYEAYGGTRFDAICKVAAAVELLHVSMCVHDDLIDRDLLRHGKANVSGSYQKIYDELKPKEANAHHANSAALLGGDLLLSGAYELIGQSGFSHQQRQAAQDIMSEAVFRTIGGEFIESNASYYDTGETDPLKIAEFKTAYYSFIFPTTVGATLADAPLEDKTLLEAFGRDIGLAFQLSDDVSDAVSDVKNANQTYLYHQAFERGNTAQKQLLHKYLGDPALTNTEQKRLQEIYQETGALKFVNEQINEYVKRATWAVGQLTVAPGYKNSLLRLIDAIGSGAK